MSGAGIGTFYGVGIGPGVPELMTRKAVRVLSEVEWIFYPFETRTGTSFSHRIIAPLGLPRHEGCSPRSKPDHTQAAARLHASSPGAASADAGLSWRKITSEKYDSFWPRKVCTSVTTRASGVPTFST